ncbi:DUF1801 domain-containing protein [Spongiactinospora sp. 9N601]|uniref:DUF1801 domain-containing protein n=1 Tax=Spongiactinospora sp. 9N601 TaxID=3375149 RepID=UPI00378D8BFD
MNDEVTQYINKTTPWQVPVCERLRAMVHETVPGIEERLQYGKPHFLHEGEHAAVIAATRNKVSFMVFNATDVPVVKGFLRALGGGERKCVDILEGQEIDFDALADVLRKTTSPSR